MLRRFLLPFVAVIGLVFAPALRAADLSITVANVANSTANTNTGVAGATITAGVLLYLDTATNTLKLCDATNATKYKCVGIALHASLSGQPITYATGGGSYTPGGTLTVGTVYLCSKTGNGAIMPYGDIASTNYLFIIGYASTSTNMVLLMKDLGVQAP